jgi:hypothetical protein
VEKRKEKGTMVNRLENWQTAVDTTYIDFAVRCVPKRGRGWKTHIYIYARTPN